MSKIPAQRQGNPSDKPGKPIPATFTPEFTNGELVLNAPTNRRPGNLSQYTMDQQVYIGALVTEVTTLRELKVKTGEEIARLNGEVEILNGKLAQAAISSKQEREEHQRTLRGLNVKHSEALSRAEIAEAMLDVQKCIHVLSGKQPIETLSWLPQSEFSSATLTFVCKGLQFEFTPGKQRNQMALFSAPNNPTKIKMYHVQRFAGRLPHNTELTHIAFLMDAATAEGLQRNRERFSPDQLDQIYNLNATNRKYACGHTAQEHADERQRLINKGMKPAVLDEMFNRLEAETATDHDNELLRASMIFLGHPQQTIDSVISTISAMSPSDKKTTLNCGHTKAEHIEMFGHEIGSFLESVGESISPFQRLTDFRMDQRGTRLDEIKRGMHDPANAFFPGYGRVRDSILRGLDGIEPLRFIKFKRNSTFDLGTDDLYDTPGGQACVDGRPASKPQHSGECRNNGGAENCTHPDHKQG